MHGLPVPGRSARVITCTPHICFAERNALSPQSPVPKDLFVSREHMQPFLLNFTIGCRMAEPASASGLVSIIQGLPPIVDK
jgi:hypothetical protein